MNRLLVLLVALLLFGYLFALSATGINFFSYATGKTSLSLQPLPALQLGLGEAVNVELSGNGLTADSRVMMHMDVNNQSAEVASLPITGGLFDMERVGQTLYLAEKENGVRRIDVSDPLRPKIVGRPIAPEHTVLDIERSANKLYLSCGRRGIRIYEVLADGRLASPKLLPTWGAAQASKVVGDFLYVAAGRDGLMIYDLQNLEESKPVANLKTDGPIFALDVYKNYLYLVAGKQGMLIYKIVDPAMPALVGKVRTQKAARFVTVAGNSLYLLESGKISQYRLTAPERPELVVEQNHFSSPFRLFHVGDKIYVADNRSGLAKIDNSSGVLPESADFYNLGGDSRAVVPVGNYLYVAVTKSGIKVLDPEKILPRQIAGQFSTPGAVKDFKIIAGHIYILDTKGQLQVQKLKVSPTEADDVLSRYIQTRTTLVSLYRQGSLLYVTSPPTGVVVLDISVPGQLQLVTEWPEINARSLAILEDRLIVARGSEGLFLYAMNETDPPELLATRTDISAREVHIENDLIIVPGEEEGIRIFRIVDDKLQFVSQLKMPFPLDRFSWALKLAVQNEILYVANGESGLLIIDIANPAEPTILSSLNLPGYANDLLIDEEKAYVSSRYSGLHTIDIRDPHKPRLLDTISISDLSGGVQRHGDLLYLGNRLMGVSVIPLPREIKNVSRLSDQRLQLNIQPPEYPGRYSLEVSSGNESAELEGVLNYQ